MTNTTEPVTLGGWYENTDGTVSEYRWIDGGRLVLRRTVSGWGSVPAREADLAAAEAADRAYYSRKDAGVSR